MTRYTKNLDLAPEMLSNSFHWSEKKKKEYFTLCQMIYVVLCDVS